jgi:hypothetical protein
MGQVHAPALHTYTPDEWLSQQGVAPGFTDLQGWSLGQFRYGQPPTNVNCLAAESGHNQP